jgi:hypothetical protein
MEEEEKKTEEIAPKQRKTGLYSRVNIRKLDLRTRLGRDVKALLRDFYEDLGGEDNVSIQVRVLVEDAIVPQLLALRAFTGWMANNEFKGMPPERLSRYWIALVNSLRLNLVTIGLERRVRDITPLSERLAALAMDQENEEGKETGKDQNN